MIKDQQAEYNELLEELRHRYRQKYSVVLDDEILYLIIRVNELQVDLKKEIKAIPKVTFQKGIDYFWYGVGRTVGFLIFGVGLIVFAAISYDSNKEKNLQFENKFSKMHEKKPLKEDNKSKRRSSNL